MPQRFSPLPLLATALVLAAGCTVAQPGVTPSAPAATADDAPLADAGMNRGPAEAPPVKGSPSPKPTSASAMPTSAGAEPEAIPTSINFTGDAGRAPWTADPKSNQLIGYVETLTVDALELPGDLAPKSPSSPENFLKVMGLISKATWAGGQQDPIMLDFQVSEANKLKLEARLKRATTAPGPAPSTPPAVPMSVTVKFQLWGINTAKTFYYTTMSLDGTITSPSQASKITVATTPSKSIKGDTWRVLIELPPSPSTVQQITLHRKPTGEPGSTDMKNFPWGGKAIPSPKSPDLR